MSSINVKKIREDLIPFFRKERSKAYPKETNIQI